MQNGLAPMKKGFNVVWKRSDSRRKIEPVKRGKEVILEERSNLCSVEKK